MPAGHCKARSPHAPLGAEVPGLFHLEKEGFEVDYLRAFLAFLARRAAWAAARRATGTR
jgi:hypothetical protein